jgi:hypothetical protein
VRKERKRGEGRKAVGRAATRKRKREKEKEGWAGPIRKREGKRNTFQMHLNLNLKFKFKWETNNKTMQWGMKYTNPIVPYISFYSLLNCFYFMINALKSK